MDLIDYCCPECFVDEIAKRVIREQCNEDLSECPLCGAKDVRGVRVAPESDLAEQIESMLDVFAPISYIPETDRPFMEQASLYNAFLKTWPVLKEVGTELFEKLIRSLFPDDERIERMFVEGVVLAPERGEKRIKDFSFFGEKTWDDFSEEIKHRHRYCFEIKNSDVLNNVLRSLEREISADSVWYRARRWNIKDGQRPTFSDLCEPPCEKAGEGRMSPKGIACLYLASDVRTALAEIRAMVHDKVAVMCLQPKHSLKILDLSRIDKISPFLLNAECAELASNTNNLKRIKAELARPMRSNDDPIEYIPTQFIADRAKSLGFDGIGFESVMGKSDTDLGYNLACFTSAESGFFEQGIKMHQITSIEYDYNLA